MNQLAIRKNATTWTAEESTLILTKAIYLKTAKDLEHRNPPEIIMHPLTREQLFQTGAEYGLDYNDIIDSLKALSHERGSEAFINKANVKFETVKSAVKTIDYTMSFVLKAERLLSKISGYISPKKKR
jgi:hypothetical protein